ncbi:16S rRNA (uracil(1498)-N(3))-methyltransferase [Synechococcus sp. Nb3U1]|uniref:16S rRNA (uracil(1498)-N(3))-methyltransferase n=1 Tax=Synechococcus sp. Nb3U1 TaxID=1914529 RepID=UPI001F265739|nr:16S rRNA (uracil(1498)-N(3))-methyltransferase [Synechococcus sp. Nb3U1]MCF2970513.1 16S rRNA (uracil(1498)-N(3))-methyltransferase [Synechococcus sp. Nb3U1]
MVLSERTHDLSALPRLAIAPEQRDPAGNLNLTGSQQHYLQRVRRLKLGDPFLVFDGSGILWLAHWQPQGSRIAGWVETRPRELPIHIHLGLAVVKGPSFDEVFRQVTELGVAQITPLLTERTVLEPGSGRQERWQKIVQEAAEQCERLRWPQIDSPTAWTDWVRELRANWWGVTVARQEAPFLLQALPKSVVAADPVFQVAIAVGPEGGWTAAELRQAQAREGVPVSLGATILRATTAAVVATSQIAAAYPCALDPGAPGSELQPQRN